MDKRCNEMTLTGNWFILHSHCVRTTADLSAWKNELRCVTWCGEIRSRSTPGLTDTSRLRLVAIYLSCHDAEFSGQQTEWRGQLTCATENNICPGHVTIRFLWNVLVKADTKFYIHYAEKSEVCQELVSVNRIIIWRDNPWKHNSYHM